MSRYALTYTPGAPAPWRVIDDTANTVVGSSHTLEAAEIRLAMLERAQ